VHRWLTTTYANDCCTFPNNDDLGTMSAQYVWATMGMYPVAPGSADVAVNGPTFTRSVIHLPSGNTLTINAPQASNSNYYIQSLKLDGAARTRSWLPAAVFSDGGQVDVTLGSVPTAWGSGPNDAPPSYDDGDTTPPGGGGNLALRRPATGSAACNDQEGPAKAVNGSVSGGNADKWCSVAGTKFLQVDLGSSVPLRSFIVRHAEAGGEDASDNTRDFDLQVSKDGAAFTTVAQVRGNTAAVTTSTATTTGRFVRLNVLTPEQGGDGAARIYELEVYGAGS
jgi:hypothetical protein